MRLPVYIMTYRCQKCGTVYAGEWNPNRAGHVESASACPACGSPVRLYLGTGQKNGGPDSHLEAVRPSRIQSPTAAIAASAQRGAA